jgi:hypothetical protein
MGYKVGEEVMSYSLTLRYEVRYSIHKVHL